MAPLVGQLVRQGEQVPYEAGLGAPLPLDILLKGEKTLENR